MPCTAGATPVTRERLLGLVKLGSALCACCQNPSARNRARAGMTPAARARSRYSGAQPSRLAAFDADTELVAVLVLEGEFGSLGDVLVLQADDGGELADGHVELEDRPGGRLDGQRFLEDADALFAEGEVERVGADGDV